MGERLLCKQEVIGSIPFTSTTHCPGQVWSELTGQCGSGTDFVTGGSLDRRWRALMDNCEEANCVTEAVSAPAKPRGFAVRVP